MKIVRLNHFGGNAGGRAARGNRAGDDGSGSDGRFFADIRHDYRGCAEPAIRTDVHRTELSLIGTGDGSIRLARVLPGSAQNLNAGGDLSPVANMGAAENAVGSDVHTGPDAGLRMGEKRSEGNPGIGGAVLKRHSIERDPQVIARESRKL